MAEAEKALPFKEAVAVVERRRRGGDRQDVKGRRPRKEGEGRKDERLAAAAAAAVAGCGGGRRRSSMDGPTEETEAELSVLSSRGVALESLEEGRKITKTPIQFRTFCLLKYFASIYFFLSSFGSKFGNVFLNGHLKALKRAMFQQCSTSAMQLQCNSYRCQTEL